MGDFNGHVGDLSFEGVHRGNGIGERNVEGRMLLEFFVMRKGCVWQTRGLGKQKRKVTFSTGGNETEIDFMLVGRKNRKYLRDVKATPGELQHYYMGKGSH
uniref:Endonuclease/exonuclease/phosphatase domain-containing protein n=1 Tax=Octopus bimaculoides TaxID=37653 RepID=A0A0L8HI00_OCTBM